MATTLAGIARKSLSSITTLSLNRYFVTEAAADSTVSSKSITPLASEVGLPRTETNNPVRSPSVLALMFKKGVSSTLPGTLLQEEGSRRWDLKVGMGNASNHRLKLLPWILHSPKNTDCNWGNW
ncbi:hypothetical protein DKX38_022905 [Salix brachista]|uniref:Uncharacterized protein n=1 Tax=Salix brachista TaxID=2182728 RepID=A0A5N5K2G0_9ROSI|nr:hypothetical protein DKX38_022905 [Salix brachista]